MKPYSITAMTTGSPPSRPRAETTASRSPVRSWYSTRRLAYGLVSTNASGSAGAISRSNSWYSPPSSSSVSRSRALILKW